MFQNSQQKASLLAIVGLRTAENEPPKNWKLKTSCQKVFDGDSRTQALEISTAKMLAPSQKMVEHVNLGVNLANQFCTSAVSVAESVNNSVRS